MKMRTALLELDLEDDGPETSSGDLRAQLMRTALHPLFVSSAEGRRFCAFALGELSPTLVPDMHAVIRNELPLVKKKSSLDDYGDIYYRAWRAASGQTLMQVELCIESLASLAIYVARPALARAVRRVLNAFHNEKMNSGGGAASASETATVIGAGSSSVGQDVDSMLARLYKGVLWRSLRAHNPSVRHNAAALFFDAFPLIDPEARATERDAALQAQFDQLEALLADSDAGVRCVAVHGVCRVLGTFWEMIPFATTQTLLLRLMKDLSHDASSYRVRCSVFDGLTYLLDNHLTHTTLKPLLPKIGDLVHDTHPAVRQSFVGLLSSASSIRTIRFFDVVPMAGLLHRLAEDGAGRSPAHRELRLALTRLLLPSFFRNGTGTPLEQMTGVLTLCHTNPAAAAHFYRTVAEFVPASAVGQLAAMLFGYIATVARKGAASASDLDTSVDDGSGRGGGVKGKCKQQSGVKAR